MSSPARNPLEPDVYAKLTGFDGKWRDTWWRNDFVELVLERAGARDARSLLDVGCGAGHWGRIVARGLRQPPSLCGVDIEQDFVDRALAAGRAAGLDALDYRRGSAEAIPHGDVSFEIVTCQTLLIHVRDPNQVLGEMRRVLKPGGTLIVAEPNNIAGYLSLMMAEPRPQRDVVSRQLEFYWTCLEGKRTLGMGDSSVGERLPALVAQAGFTAIQVAVNENCPALIPPYREAEQQIECEFLRTTVGSGAWLGFGPHANARRFYLAGGGGRARSSSAGAKP